MAWLWSTGVTSHSLADWFGNLQSLNAFTWCWVTKAEWDCYWNSGHPTTQWPLCQNCWGWSWMWCWSTLDNVPSKRPLQTLKQQGWRLEHHWQKTKSVSNQTLHRAHAQSYAEAIALVKKSYFASIIASARSCPFVLYAVVWGLLQSGPAVEEGEHSVACCDAFVNNFTGKIDHIWLELDGLVKCSEPGLAGACPVLWDIFPLIQFEEVVEVWGQWLVHLILAHLGF